MTVSLPALIRSASTCVVGGVGADAEDAVLGLQHDGDVRGQVLGHQGRQADAEVDVLAVAQLEGDAGGELVTGQRHAQASFG